MYSNNLEVIENSQHRAKEIIYEKDSILYIKFFKEIEKFSSEKKMIVSGYVANILINNVISEEKINYNNFYEFYSNDPLIHSRELAGILFNLDPDNLGRYVSVITKIVKKNFLIMLNSRIIVSILAFPKINNINTKDIITTIITDSIFNEDIKLLCMSPEIQLINIYYNLTNPSYIKTWKDNLKYEKSLRNYLLTDFKHIRENKMNEFHEFRKILLDNFIPKNGRVIIGSAAINIMLNKPIVGMDLLQIVTENDFKYEIDEIKELAAHIDIVITYKINHLNLFIDTRLEKMTVFINEENQKIPIINIFNSAKYDLIPYIPINFLYNKTSKQLDVSIKIGTPFLLMRYKLMDLYVIYVIHKLNSIKTKFMQQIKNEILTNFLELSEWYEKKIMDVNNINMFILPISNYIGRFESYELYSKRNAFKNNLKLKEDGKFYPNYLPLMKHQNNNESIPVVQTD